MRQIALKNGGVALVDDVDYDALSVYVWRLSPYGYAVRRVSYGDRESDVRMHRQILGLLENKSAIVDHIDGNRLDNRRTNLRVCTQTENSRNRRRHTNNTSGYKGVSKRPSGSYRAQIKVDGKKIHLGTFASAEEAHKAYCNAARKYHGEFFRPN